MGGAALLLIGCAPPSPPQASPCPEIPTDTKPEPPLTRAEPRPEEPQPEETPLPADDAEDLARLTNFDCTSSYEHKAGESLRRFKNGGPAGATWNWYGSDLTCTVHFETTCEAQVYAHLIVGKHHEFAHSLLAKPGGKESTHFEVKSSYWEHVLVDAKYAPIELGRFTIELEGKCTREEGGFLLTDSFLGGFAGGE